MKKTITTLALLLAATFAFAGNTAQASKIHIFVKGVDISYDSGTGLITDIPDGGPDPVFSIEIKDGVSLAGPAITPGTLDIEIPGVASIPTAGGTVTSGSGGFFDLDFAGHSLHLDLGTADVTYVPAAGFEFNFANALASIDSQSLPYGLSMTDPISVSISTQATDTGSAGGFLTSFVASGTGEAFEVVPEPTTMGLLTLGGLLASMVACRYRLG